MRMNKKSMYLKALLDNHYATGGNTYNNYEGYPINEDYLQTFSNGQLPTELPQQVANEGVKPLSTITPRARNGVQPMMGGIETTTKLGKKNVSTSGLAGGLDYASGLVDNLTGANNYGRKSIGSTTGSSALKGAAAGTAILPGWGTLIGGAVGALAGLFKGGKERGNERKSLQQQFRNNQLAYNNNSLQPNIDMYGNTYAEGGATGPDVPTEEAGQAPPENPMRKINVEKGELMVDPATGDIIRKFNNPNRFSSHEKKQLKEPIGNFVTVPVNMIIIPRKNAARYERGDILTRSSIMKQLLSDQANDPFHNTPDEEVPNGMTEQHKKGGRFMGINPAHKGYCTPMTKATCTPRRKALARTLKKHHGFNEEGGIVYADGGTIGPGDLYHPITNPTGYRTKSRVNLLNNMAAPGSRMVKDGYVTYPGDTLTNNQIMQAANQIDIAGQAGNMSLMPVKKLNAEGVVVAGMSNNSGPTKWYNENNEMDLYKLSAKDRMKVKNRLDKKGLISDIYSFNDQAYLPAPYHNKVFGPGGEVPGVPYKSAQVDPVKRLRNSWMYPTPAQPAGVPADIQPNLNGEDLLQNYLDVTAVNKAAENMRLNPATGALPGNVQSMQNTVYNDPFVDAVDRTPPPKAPREKLNFKQILGDQLMNLPIYGQMINSLKGDKFLQANVNTAYADALGLANQLPETVSIAGNLFANDNSFAAAARGLNDNDTPSVRAERGELYARKLAADNQAFQGKSNVEVGLKSSKLQQILGTTIAQGADAANEGKNLMNSLREDKSGRENMFAAGAVDLFKNMQLRHNDREAIKAINEVSHFVNVVPGARKLMMEDPEARDYILSYFAAGKGSIQQALDKYKETKKTVESTEKKTATNKQKVTKTRE